jgi:hypothetical protein
LLRKAPRLRSKVCRSVLGRGAAFALRSVRSPWFQRHADPFKGRRDVGGGERDRLVETRHGSARKPPVMSDRRGSRVAIHTFVYPSRFVSGRTVALHCRRPHCEQRSRFTTSASNASHPANAASVFGCAVRVCPHSHLSVSTYWPKWSDSLTTVSSGRGGIIRRLSRA